MSLQLPDPAAAYFAADSSSAAAVTKCFAKDAVVKDEGETYTGIAAIKKWKAGTSTKYTYTCTPLGSKKAAGKLVVTCRLAGNFPGSPVNLRYFFGLEGDKIAFLKIAP